MAPRWELSSDKHGIDRRDQIFAILNANYVAILEERQDGSAVMLYIGPEHGQTDRELEILVHSFADGRQASVFHAMLLGPKFRRYREDHPDV